MVSFVYYRSFSWEKYLKKFPNMDTFLTPRFPERAHQQSAWGFRIVSSFVFIFFISLIDLTWLDVVVAFLNCCFFMNTLAHLYAFFLFFRLHLKVFVFSLICVSFSLQVVALSKRCFFINILCIAHQQCA